MWLIPCSQTSRSSEKYHYPSCMSLWAVGQGGQRGRKGGQCLAGEDLGCQCAKHFSVVLLQARDTSDSLTGNMRILERRPASISFTLPCRPAVQILESVLFNAVAGGKVLPGVTPKPWCFFSVLLSRRWEIRPVNLHSHVLPAFE